MENTKKMEYTEFKESLKNLVQEKSDSDMKVEIVQIIKNNQIKSENLTYKSRDYNLFPSAVSGIWNGLVCRHGSFYFEECEKN